MNDFLPEGWEEEEVDKLVTFKKGKKPQRLKLTPFDNSVPYLDIKALETGIIDQYAEVESSNLADENDLLIVWDGSRAGWIGLGRIGAIASTIMAIRPFLIDKLYFYYFLQSQYNTIKSQQKGVGVPHVDSELFGKLTVPIAPFSEQQRIVAVIEERLHQVEKSRNQFQKLQADLQQYRREIVTSAISGQLTENWRANDDYKTIDLGDSEVEIPVNWQGVVFGHLIVEMKNGLSKKPANSPPGIPILRISSVRPNSVDLTEHKFLNTSEVPDSFLLKEFDLLFTRYNGSLDLLGICGIVKGINKQVITYPDKLIRVRTKPEVLLPEYAQLFFLSEYARALILTIVKSGAGLNGISGKSLQELPFILPPVEEQREILKLIAEQTNLADTLEANYNNALSEIEALPQIILTKAFSGDLTEQYPTDESAMVLLERIRLERETAANEPKLENDKTKRSKKMTEIKLLEVILQTFPNQSFTFDELRQKTTKGYEVLRDELYGLIEIDKKVIHQFDTTTQSLTFSLAIDANPTN